MVIALNNYMHDFFAALLFASLLLGIYLGGLFKREKAPAALRAKTFGFLKRIIWSALALTVLLGIPRILHYTGYLGGEAMAAEYGFVAVKHIVLFLAVGGMLLWSFRRMR